MYLPLHCHHQNDFCVKVGSDESHFNVSLLRERRAEADSNRGPSAYQPNALPLGQTGSHVYGLTRRTFVQSAQNLTPEKSQGEREA